MKNADRKLDKKNIKERDCTDLQTTVIVFDDLEHQAQSEVDLGRLLKHAVHVQQVQEQLHRPVTHKTTKGYKLS
jgi:hypothetical protein